MGGLPNVYPGYQNVENEDARKKFESAWNSSLNKKSGMAVTEMIEGALHDKVKALYVVGENPLMSEPDLNHSYKAIKKLDFLVVQDIFPTETALMADVILPAALFAEKDGTFTNTERRVQKLNKAIEPPKGVKTDWEIISLLAEKMDFSYKYKNTADIMKEIAEVTPIYGGIFHDRLDQSGLQWPCKTRDDEGTPFLHKGTFPIGKGKFHSIEHKPPAETTSRDYPLTLTTGRLLEHFHTGSMTRRSTVLDKTIPDGSVELHPEDAEKLGILDGDRISLSSNRGKIETYANVTKKTNPGVAFMAFHWNEAPVNKLTNSASDPISKIPELKFSAAKAVLSVLDKAAEDNEFFAKLLKNPDEILDNYGFTDEIKSAFSNGDIDKIESLIGKSLDVRLKEWLITRFKQNK
jgi:predicted molibdopterin-dependent oxidoreductase YjgC